MLSSLKFVGALILTLLVVFCQDAYGIETSQCYAYNASCGEECTKIVNCPADVKRKQCFVYWKQEETKAPVVALMGCFSDDEACFDKESCLGEEKGKNSFFCCCEGSLCNQNFTRNPNPKPLKMSKSLADLEAADVSHIQQILLIVMCILIILTLFVFLGLFLFLRYKPNKVKFQEVQTKEPPNEKQLLSHAPIHPVQLLEIVAHGRFSTVWKAQYNTETVAVKIFPPQEELSWRTECSIYQLPHMNHDSILYFIAAEQHNNPTYSKTEFWLISTYHELGSLCDWLKGNTLSWPELCRLAESIASGLAHIHEELPATKGFSMKPSIAHRDFKSKNILLKSDLTACIADFGLALLFETGRSCGETHGQVGTRRYMAPEVLEGAITFSNSAFLRIDMYAFGLVLWEMARRCTDQEGDVPEYSLPFEEELGQHPSLEAMQYCVVMKKSRPKRPDAWYKHPGLASLCNTMEECWDHDPEARLTSSCVHERFIYQSQSLVQSPKKSPSLININSSDVIIIDTKLDSV